MKTVLLCVFVMAGLFLPIIPWCQNSEKIQFDSQDSTDGYYLAIRPKAKDTKGAIVLFTSFLSPESLLQETKLHTVAYANGLLTIVVSLKKKLYADSFAVGRINTILKDVVTRFSADTSHFVLAGYNEAGSVALRYTEFAYEHPPDFLVHPKAVFGIDTSVDLFGLWHWSEGQIKKNFWPGSVGDANYYIGTMTKENGTIYSHPEKYKFLSPFSKADTVAGNERYLKDVAVRLYYDTDAEWQLKNRRNSFYDTNIPDGSEFIKRLLLLGNSKAEFVASKQPGMRSDGLRHPNSLSIVDEVDCIQWVKKSLDLFDAATWVPTYYLPAPTGWDIERFLLPPDFAPQMSYTGIEDIRFMPGWGKPASEEHWAYSFLWWLKGKPKIDAAVLQISLHDYYTGLVTRNIISRNIPSEKQVSVVVAVKKIKPVLTDLETYSGTVKMLDYHTQEPIVLNCLIHVKDSNGTNHTAVYFEVSPQLLTHPVWKKLHQIGEQFGMKD